jgi:hypothetical protein
MRRFAYARRYSDGSCVRSVGTQSSLPSVQTGEAAVARGLDFIAISDHNTISQYNNMRELQPDFDHLLLMPGREITTFCGHASVYDTTSLIDFRIGGPHVPTINQMLRQVQQQHGLFSINHPSLPSGAACMGCGWTAPDTDYSKVTSIEAINGGSLERSLFWYSLLAGKLNHGFRSTGVDGSGKSQCEPCSRRKIGGWPSDDRCLRFKSLRTRDSGGHSSWACLHRSGRSAGPYSRIYRTDGRSARVHGRCAAGSKGPAHSLHD